MKLSRFKPSVLAALGATSALVMASAVHSTAVDESAGRTVQSRQVGNPEQARPLMDDQWRIGAPLDDQW